MSNEDRQELPARVEEIARLFVRIADERPAVLDALHALLRALAPTETPTHSDDRPASDSPTATPVDAIPNGGGIAAQEERAPETAPEVTIAPAPRIHVEPTPEAKRGLEALMERFGSLRDSPGLGASGSASAQEVLSSRWDDDIDEARRLARLLRAQSRRLRSIRLAAHDGLAVPPVDHVLANARVDDWTADPTRVARLAARDLREGERWYALAARAAAEVGDWLSEHPEADLGFQRTPDALRDRLQCLANAQKGIYSWIEQVLGYGQSCGVQHQAHLTLKGWISRDYFGVYLASGMVLAQRITSAERDETVRALQRFELEHASNEPANGAICHVPAVEPQPAAAPERFDSVHAAFLAARAVQTDGLVVYTERAEDSAEDSAFKRPEEVFDFLEVLHGIARDLRNGLLEGRRLDLVFAERGFKSKPCAQSTMKRYRRFYHMVFEGSEVDLSQHVTLGSRNQNTCMSIHWWHDKANRRFVVGHCGKHLPNTLT